MRDAATANQSSNECTSIMNGSNSTANNKSSKQSRKLVFSKWKAVRLRRKQQLLGLPIDALVDIVDKATITADQDQDETNNNNTIIFKNIISTQSKPNAANNNNNDKTIFISYIIDKLLQKCFTTAFDQTIDVTSRQTCLNLLMKFFQIFDECILHHATKELALNDNHDNDGTSTTISNDKNHNKNIVQNESSEPSEENDVHQMNNNSSNDKSSEDIQRENNTSTDDRIHEQPPQSLVLEDLNSNEPTQEIITTNKEKRTTTSSTPVEDPSRSQNENLPKKNSDNNNDASINHSSSNNERDLNSSTLTKSTQDDVPKQSSDTTAPPAPAKMQLVPLTPLPIVPRPTPYNDSHAVNYVEGEMYRLALYPTSSSTTMSLTTTRPQQDDKDVITFESPEEIHTSKYVSALISRPPCTISYLKNNVMVYNEVQDFYKRLKRWDPFWSVRHDIIDICCKYLPYKQYDTLYKVKSYSSQEQSSTLPILTTQPVTNVTPLHGGYNERFDPNAVPKQCCAFEFRLPSYIAQEVSHWGSNSTTSTPPTNGELRFICRTLPLDSKAKKKTIADTHLWPKGTFFLLGAGPTNTNNGLVKPIQLVQRRQQAHDNKLWKGNCNHLDLTGYIKHPQDLHNVRIVTREDAKYGIQLCIAEYQSPESVFEETLRNIMVLSYDEAKQRAIKYVNDQTVCLDDSDDDDDTLTKKSSGNDVVRGAHLKFKLICPISMTPMEIPVRGQHCKHLQCFELQNFIECNSFPSGRRWKCPCCDDFVSLDTLLVCGLFRQITAQHKAKITQESYDTVRIYQDGSWELEEIQKQKKRRCDVAFEQQHEDRSNKRKAPVEEISILD